MPCVIPLYNINSNSRYKLLPSLFLSYCVSSLGIIVCFEYFNAGTKSTAHTNRSYRYGGKIVFSDLERIEEEAITGYFKVLSRHQSGRNEEKTQYTLDRMISMYPKVSTRHLLNTNQKHYPWSQTAWYISWDLHTVTY